MYYYEILKKRRLDLNLSVQDIAISSHLAPEFIRAIEDNNLDVFAQDLSYVRYFVRAYADVLGVNWQAIQAEVDGNVEVYARARDQALTQAQRIMAAQMQAAQESRSRASRSRTASGKKQKSRQAKGKNTRRSRNASTQNPYHTGTQPVYNTMSQPVYHTGTQPVHNTMSQPVYQTGTQPLYNTGTQPVYQTGTQPIYQTGTQPVYNTSTQQMYTTSQQIYNTGMQPRVGSRKGKAAKKRKKRKVSFFKSSANAVSRMLNWNSRDSLTKFMVIGTACALALLIALNYITDSMNEKNLEALKEERQQELLKKEQETQRLADQLQNQKQADAQANGTAPVITPSTKNTNTFFITNVLGVTDGFSLNIVPESKFTVTMKEGDEQIFSQQVSQEFSKTIKVNQETTYEITCSDYTSKDQISINGTQLTLNPSGFTNGYGTIVLKVLYYAPDETEKDKKEKESDTTQADGSTDQSADQTDTSTPAADGTQTDIYGNPVYDANQQTDIYGNPIADQPVYDIYGNLIDPNAQTDPGVGVYGSDTIADLNGGVIEDDGGELYGYGN